MLEWMMSCMYERCCVVESEWCCVVEKNEECFLFRMLEWFAKFVVENVRMVRQISCKKWWNGPYIKELSLMNVSKNLIVSYIVIISLSYQIKNSILSSCYKINSQNLLIIKSKTSKKNPSPSKNLTGRGPENSPGVFELISCYSLTN